MKSKTIIAFSVLALTAPLAAMAQNTVFSDNFSGSSTVQSASPGAGTANSADYEVFTSAAAPSGQNIGSGALNFGTISTGSVLGEVEARFGGSPVTLTTIGDYINLTITFVDTAGVLVSGENVNASLNIGLFNSGGVNLNQGVRLDAGTTSSGSQTWLGYDSRLFLNGNASSFNRNTQAANGTTSQNQDLLFNNASSSSAFNSPGGTTSTATFGTGLGSGTSGTLTAGNTYTMSLTLTLAGLNSIRLTNELFSGSSATGTPIVDNAGTFTGGNFLTNSFDGLALGYRDNNAPGPNQAASLDISDITVSTDVTAVPEPATLALSAFGGLGLLAIRRLRNRK